jgi:hypothetical protein
MRKNKDCLLMRKDQLCEPDFLRKDQLCVLAKGQLSAQGPTFCACATIFMRKDQLWVLAQEYVSAQGLTFCACATIFLAHSDKSAAMRA